MTDVPLSEYLATVYESGRVGLFLVLIPIFSRLGYEIGDGDRIGINCPAYSRCPPYRPIGISITSPPIASCKRKSFLGLSGWAL